MYKFSLPTYSKRLKALIYSSIAVKIFEVESNENYQWP